MHPVITAPASVLSPQMSPPKQPLLGTPGALSGMGWETMQQAFYALESANALSDASTATDHPGDATHHAGEAGVFTGAWAPSPATRQSQPLDVANLPPHESESAATAAGNSLWPALHGPSDKLSTGAVSAADSGLQVRVQLRNLQEGRTAQGWGPPLTPRGETSAPTGSSATDGAWDFASSSGGAAGKRQLASNTPNSEGSIWT